MLSRLITRICAWIVSHARLDLRTIRDGSNITVEVYADGWLIARSKDGANDVFGGF